MMKRKLADKAWGRAFLTFVEAEPVDPPEAISENIHKAVARDLRILPWKVFLKFATIQAVVAFMTLLVCPQFEVDLGIVRHDDAHLRALFGETGYMVFCGALFLSTGTVLATLLLRAEELRAIKKMEYFYFILTSAFALIILGRFGMSAVPAAYAAWFAGALGGSMTGYEIIKKIKLSSRKTGAVHS